MGIGSAYTQVMREGLAKGDFVVIMDGDLSHHPKYIPQLIEKQRETGADVVIGTRYAAGGGIVGWGLKRKLVSRVANFVSS